MARLGTDRSVRAAGALSLTIFLLGSTAGYLAIGQAFVERSSGVDGFVPAAGTLPAILAANTGAALLLYSGAVTLGLSTLVGLIMLSVYVGATVKVGVVTSGWGDLLRQVGLYAPLEFVGLLVVAAAGLYPLTSSLRTRGTATPTPAARRYVAAVPRSLVLLGVGLCLVLAAATAEALIIRHR